MGISSPETASAAVPTGERFDDTTPISTQRPTDPESEARTLEDQKLKAAYFDLLLRRYPFNSDIGKCPNKEYGLFFAYDREYLRPPEHLSYHALESSIEEIDRPRIEGLWRKLKQCQAEWEKSVAHLKGKWKKAVAVEDKGVEQIIDEISHDVKEDLRAAMKSVITIAPATPLGAEAPPLVEWKDDEKNARRGYRTADKKYLLSLRMYYEALLESGKNRTEDVEDSFILLLPKEDPRRQEIALRNRYARLIDGTHQGIVTAKAAHHEQKDGRQREKEKAPYVRHPINVAMKVMNDVVPFIIEEHKIGEIDPLIFVLLALLHDLLEDSGYFDTPEQLVDYLKAKTDIYDSTLEPLIQSGFKDISREEMKQKVLDLIKGNVRTFMVQGLRVLSANTVLKNEEKLRALRKNIAGKQKTRNILKLSDEDKKQWGIMKKVVKKVEGKHQETFVEDMSDDEPKSETFKQIPDHHAGKYGDKIDAFLVRLDTLTTGPRQQVALITKLEDRADNLLTSDKLKPEARRGNLRATVARLIAWCMLDHNRKYPLYNAIHRLINVALNQYEKFESNCPEYFEEFDRECITRLRSWKEQARVIRFPVPPKVQEVYDEFELSAA